MPKLEIKRILISLIFSFSIASFFYLLVLQLPFISKSRLLFSFLFSVGIMFPIYETSTRIWGACVAKYKFIVLFASFLGLIVANSLFYYPRISYLFYGQHELEVVLDESQIRNSPIIITALFTDLKTESYSQFQVLGGKWQRTGNVFSTNGLEPTKIIWNGWTGSKVTIKFRKMPVAGNIMLVWDNEHQTIDLEGIQNESLSIVHEFKPPLWGKVFLWLLSTLVISYIISLLLWLDEMLRLLEFVPSARKLERVGLRNIINAVIVFFLFFSVLNVFIPINPNRLIRDRDDGAFLYIGRQVINGQIPYLNLWDHKGPLIYYINAAGLFLAGDNEWGVWFIQVIWLFFVALLAYRVISELTGEIPALIGTYLLLLFIKNPLYGGNYTEEYALLPLFLCWFGFQKFILEDEPKWLWLVGFSTGLAFLLRPNLVSGQLGVALVLLFLSWKDKNVKPLYSLFVGLVSVLVPVILYFYSKGALNDMFSAFYLYNRNYIGGAFNVMEYIYKGLESYKKYFGLVILGLIFLILYFLQSVSRTAKARNLFLSALLLGFLAEIWLSNLAPYQYKHYYILWAAYFSIFSSFLFAWFTGVIYKFIDSYMPLASQILFPFVLVFLFVGFTNNNLAANLKNRVFDAKDNSAQELLAEIRPYESCCSYLLVWGAEPQINFALDKESPSRYFYQYALFSDRYSTSEMISEFTNDIIAKQPLIIDTSATNIQVYPLSHDSSPIFTKQTTERLQPFLNYIANNYYLVHEMSNGWLIYLPKP